MHKDATVQSNQYSSQIDLGYGLTRIKGFIWRIYEVETPQKIEIFNSETKECIGSVEYGFYGCDIYPCLENAEYVCDDVISDEKAFYVVTEANQSPVIVDSWEAELAELEPGWISDDGYACTVAIRKEDDDQWLLIQRNYCSD